MRAHVDAFTRRGGNVAFFSGNIGGYRVHSGDDDTAMVCAKVAPPGKTPQTWERRALGRSTPRTAPPASASTGRRLVGRPARRRSATRCSTTHWVYEGTGLSDGDVFGADPVSPARLRGDGADFAREAGLARRHRRRRDAAVFFILGIAELGEGWSRRRTRPRRWASTRAPAAASSSRARPPTGRAWSGATPQVDRITRNVLDRLRLRAVPVLGPLPVRDGRMLAAAGETVSVHADLAHLGRGDLTCEWSIAGAELATAAGALASITVGQDRGPVTASVIVRDADGAPIGFGTCTFLPLTPREALQVEITTLLREMVMPSEPSSPMVVPTDDPLDRIGDVIAVRLPWLRERAQRLERVTAELMALDQTTEGREG